MAKPFFVMRNTHVDSCGEPPAFSNEAPGRYHGYFENAYGEQWVFVYDPVQKKGELRGGDVGWEHVTEVVDDKAQGIVLAEDELQWLRACWQAATRRCLHADGRT